MLGLGMRSLLSLFTLAGLLATGLSSSPGRACGTAPPECGPLVSDSGTSIPANATAIRLSTPLGLYRISPDELELSVTDADGISSAVDVAVSEPTEGVYDVVPAMGFAPMAAYTVSAPSPCDGVTDLHTIAFTTGVEEPLPDLATAQLLSSVSSATFAHFDSVACVARPEQSRTAVLTGPEVDPEWADILL